MTVKLNLTIDEEVVKRTKRYAKRTNTSISKMVQEYLDKTTQNEKADKKSFVEKYGGSLKGHLNDKEIERLKAERIKESMATKIFLDTNIILDILDTERPFSKESKVLFKLIEDGALMAYFSESLITTTDYILIKKFTNAKRVSILSDLLKLITIVECTNTIVQNALLKNEPDVEDAILYELALSQKLDYFITNDKQALKKTANKKLPIVTTKDFLLLMNVK